MSESFEAPGSGALIATSITAQTLGGSATVVWLAFHHIDVPANGVSAQSLEDALTLLFATGFSVLAILGHLVVAFFVQKYLTPKT